MLLADTVGFVRRLPHHLVEAFQSTLSEVGEADLLLHVVDGTDPDPAGQIAAVREVLLEIGAAEIPELIAINKADRIGEHALTRLGNLYPDAVFISALKGTGLEDLLERIGSLMERTMVTLTLGDPLRTGRPGRRRPSGGRGDRGEARRRRDDPRSEDPRDLPGPVRAVQSLSFTR